MGRYRYIRSVAGLARLEQPEGGNRFGLARGGAGEFIYTYIYIIHIFIFNTDG